MKTKIFLLIILFSSLALAQTKTDSADQKSKIDTVITKAKLASEFEAEKTVYQKKLQERVNELMTADIVCNRIDAMIILLQSKIDYLKKDSPNGNEKIIKINKE